MKLVACETVTTTVLHLRQDDGQRKTTVGLDCNAVLFCHPKKGTRGWDVREPVPESPDEALASRSYPRFCVQCLAEWARMLQHEQAPTALEPQAQRA